MAASFTPPPADASASASTPASIPATAAAVLALARRVVIKIGSSIICGNAGSGELRQDWLDTLLADVAALRAAGKEVLLVSSGAVALGRGPLQYGARPLKLEEKQAAAACGQVLLSERYRAGLAVHGLPCAQVLLSIYDTEHRRRYLNARTTVNTLLAAGAVPLFNENDALATTELRYGDNDRLAARIAAMVSADLLLIFSDIDGLYTADPRRDPAAAHIAQVGEITAETEALAGGAGSALGTGGMRTKVQAARLATGAGCHMLLAPGEPLHPVRRVEEGGRCTWFVAHDTPRSARRHWIAANLHPSGRLIADHGAARALRNGASLLPAGVTAVEGDFDRGDPVVVVDMAGQELARGLVAYPSTEARQILGRRSQEIAAILGYTGREELIHRDDLVLTREGR